MSVEQVPLGECIRVLRHGRMTQRELATAADVSIDLIRKLEQGQRHTATVANLHKIARVLDVDIVDLFGRRSIPEETPDGGVTSLRLSVMHLDSFLGVQGDPMTLEDAERTKTYLWGASDFHRLDAVARLAPKALADLRATLQTADSEIAPRIAEILTEVYQVAGRALNLLQQPDAGFIAIQHAIAMSGHGEDELLTSSTMGALGWHLLRQGRFAESEKICRRTAEKIEPHGEVPTRHLSLYGSLILSSATAAARNGNPGQAEHALNEAKDVARVLPGTTNDFNKSFGTSQIIKQSVDINIQAENYTDALAMARLMPDNSGLPFTDRARYWADLGHAHTRLGHDGAAVEVFLRIDNEDSDWLPNSPYGKRTVKELVQRERRRGTPLGVLANKIGVEISV